MGEHFNREAKLTQVIDDDACLRIVNRFNAAADAGTLSHGHKMLIDHEHFRHDRDKETIAYGWLQRLQNRDDGIYGQVRWSATGQKAVDGGDYRFFSTEYDPKDLKVLNDRKVRPLRLDGLSLTNEPNNKGARPITNRETLADAGASAGNQNKQNQNSNRMKNIATKLGLAAEASEDAILAELTKIQNRVTTLEPLATENTTLKNRITELDAANVDALLANHGVKDVKVHNRMKPILVAAQASDRQACLDELLPKAAALTTAAAAGQQQKPHNRDTTPGRSRQGG